MDADGSRLELTNRIRILSASLGIACAAPYLTRDTDGQEVQLCGYLPDFGGPNGIVIEAWFPGEARSNRYLGAFHRVADRDDFYRSLVNPESLESLDGFAEALADWAFYGVPARYSSRLAELGVPNFGSRREEI